MSNNSFKKLFLGLVLGLIISYISSNKIFNYINNFTWSLATIIIFASGLYFSVKLKLIQLNFKEMMQFLFIKNNATTVSTFESLMMSLGARIGVGSLAGVSLGIYIGGAGTIFWIWIIAILTSTNTFAESVLGVKYQNRQKDMCFGGPAYYIKNGIKNKSLAITYAILLIIAYIVGFLTIQSNTIVNSLLYVTNWDKYFIIVGLIVITAFFIFRNSTKLIKLLAKIVPLMGVIYIIIGIIITIKNITIVPNIFSNIISNAFNFKSFLGGFIPTFIIGIQRGIFSTEVGLGTSAIASASTNNTPYQQGLVQTLGIHFTSLVICTITAIIILSSNYQMLKFNDINGIEIISNAFNYHLGTSGSIVLTAITILFAFSTIISGYYYGESNLKFLFPKVGIINLRLFKLCCLTILIGGCLYSAIVIWNIVDTFVVLLAILNIYVVFKLRHEVISEYQKNNS